MKEILGILTSPQKNTNYCNEENVLSYYTPLTTLLDA